jgi:hypothetical protein
MVGGVGGGSGGVEGGVELFDGEELAVAGLGDGDGGLRGKASFRKGWGWGLTLGHRFHSWRLLLALEPDQAKNAAAAVL